MDFEIYLIKSLCNISKFLNLSDIEILEVYIMDSVMSSEKRFFINGFYSIYLSKYYL